MNAVYWQLEHSAQGLDAAVQEAHPGLTAAHQSIGRLQGAGLACMPPSSNKWVVGLTLTAAACSFWLPATTTTPAAVRLLLLAGTTFKAPGMVPR